ncbi:MAG: hypothetical protein ABJB97_11835 [Acidobacteriota bacterium]
MQAAPMVIDRPADKTRIVVTIRSIIVDKESGSDLEQAAKDAQAQAVLLHEVVQFPSLSSLRYETTLIEPFDLPFHELVALLKDHYLKPTRNAKVSTDLGLVFDQRDGHFLRRVNLGPMDKTQLNTEVLKWPLEDAPDTFAFVNLAYQDTEERDFSEGALAAFMSQALEWQRPEIESLAEELKEARK